MLPSQYDDESEVVVALSDDGDLVTWEGYHPALSNVHIHYTLTHRCENTQKTLFTAVMRELEGRAF